MTSPDSDPRYDTRHTSADPSEVVTETEVDNEDKALPTSRNVVLIVSIAAAIMGLLGWLLAFSSGGAVDVIGFIIALLSLLAAGAMWINAAGDMRTGTVLPALVTIFCGVMAAVTLFDMLDAEDADLTVDTQEVLLGEPADSEALDGDADLGRVD